MRNCCAIVIPPAAHRRAVELAAARGLDILSEKPLADSWEDSVAIYRAAKAAGGQDAGHAELPCPILLS